MIPAINVNLRPCTCPTGWPAEGVHWPGLGVVAECPTNATVLIPCPIPRSVTFSVVLGECTCLAQSFPAHPIHAQNCPGRPIRVSCSVTGKTWADSEVADVDYLAADLGDVQEIYAACRDRWALVKALVLNDERTKDDPKSHYWDLMYQRDAVFSALADMARAEQAHFNASTSLFSALKACDVEREHVTGPASYAMGWDDPSDADAALNSRAGLAAYVALLIEQVGIL